MHNKKTLKFIEKANEIHNSIYNYSKTNYISYREKVLITCHKHGDFQQTPAQHTTKKAGCPKCGREQGNKKQSKTTEQFIKEAKEIHGNKYDYSLVNYVNAYTPVIIICSIHGKFSQHPSTHINKVGCNKCGQQKTGNKTRKTTEQFIKEAKEIHGNKYDYSKVDYNRIDKNVIIGCLTHGDFQQTPKMHLRGSGCNKCAVERSIEVNVKTTEQFIKEAKEIHGDKYDYSLVNYVNAHTPITIICPIHGKFNQIPPSHTRGYGCKQCATRDTQETFIKKSKSVHGDRYDYSKVIYNYSTDKVIITCSKHGDFKQQAQSHVQGRGCPICGMELHVNISTAETEINDFITSLNYKTQIGCRSLITPLELDIVIPDKKIAIEYNGSFWHSELCGKDKHYHLNKTRQCNEKGYRLIHVSDNEWINSKELVLSRIKNILGHSDRIFARKCSILKLKAKESREFLDNNHIQGFHSATYHYGLTLNNEIITVMTFGKSRFNKNHQWELIRYANKMNTSVVGGASKLFKCFITHHNPTSIITYSDKRWNTGNLYEQLGFKYSHSSNPNYFYFHKSNTTVLLSRQQFQKHKLKDKLDKFDPKLTEWENMVINGYNRIWDCGNDVYVWT